ncbi:hypothetical protein DPEC_G00115090 [Dallia pectoralis]|uniref:Uncharacterized protein n=1 Tax=Dallia pectoralis TaxID=75939 RepID=A0ACC2GUA7_DALPE|nr:hypothetical protein DPEC_G00115090 [Dallia pectoralis]
MRQQLFSCWRTVGGEQNSAREGVLGPYPPAGEALMSRRTASELATLEKLRMKGSGLTNRDPNSVKRNRINSTDITARVQKNLSSPNMVHIVNIHPPVTT